MKNMFNMYKKMFTLVLKSELIPAESLGGTDEEQNSVSTMVEKAKIDGIISWKELNIILEELSSSTENITSKTKMEIRKALINTVLADFVGKEWQFETDLVGRIDFGKSWIKNILAKDEIAIPLERVNNLVSRGIFTTSNELVVVLNDQRTREINFGDEVSWTVVS